MTKTIYCMHAVYDRSTVGSESSHAVVDLKSYLVDVRARCPRVVDTEIKPDGKEAIRIQRFEERGGRVFVQLVRYVTGDRMPTVLSMPVDSEDVGGYERAPKGKEYRDGDCYLLVSGTNVVFCPNGICLDSVERYLTCIIGDVVGYIGHIKLIPVAKVDKVALIVNHGVRSISLRASAHSLSVEQKIREGRKYSIVDEILSLFRRDDSVSDLDFKSRDIMIGLEVSSRGNHRASQSSKNVLGALGRGLVESKFEGENNITITTGNNERISASEISLQKLVRIKMKDKSLDYESVFREMSGYMDDLESSGVLDG